MSLYPRRGLIYDWDQMRRIGLLAMALAAMGGISCGPDPDPPPPPESRCCVSGAVRTIRVGSCNVGEVAVALGQCEQRDAGSTCGDGRYQSGAEACDPSASDAPTCATGICSNCACVAATCGDGVVMGTETCERRTDCAVAATAACRACQCRALTDPIQFNDVAGDAATASGADIEFVELSLGRVDGDSIRMKNRFVSGPPDKLSAICFVITSTNPEQQLCLERLVPAGQQVVFRDGPDMRVLSDSDVIVGGPLGANSTLIVKPSLPLRLEPSASFAVRTYYDGQPTDALPDTGVISFEQVFGK